MSPSLLFQQGNGSVFHEFEVDDQHDHITDGRQYAKSAKQNYMPAQSVLGSRAYQALVWSRISEIVILGDVYFPLPFQGGINA